MKTKKIVLSLLLLVGWFFSFSYWLQFTIESDTFLYWNKQIYTPYWNQDLEYSNFQLKSYWNNIYFPIYKWEFLTSWTWDYYTYNSYTKERNLLERWQTLLDWRLTYNSFNYNYSNLVSTNNFYYRYLSFLGNNHPRFFISTDHSWFGIIWFEFLNDPYVWINTEWNLTTYYQTWNNNIWRFTFNLANYNYVDNAWIQLFVPKSITYDVAATYRFFDTKWWQLSSGVVNNNWSSTWTSFMASSFQEIRAKDVQYHLGADDPIYSEYIKTFSDIGSRGATFVSYGNGYSYVSERWINTTDNMMSWEDLHFGWRWNISNIKEDFLVTKDSDLEYVNYLILNPLWLKQNVWQTPSLTVVLSKSREHPSMIEYNLYDCAFSHFDDPFRMCDEPYSKWYLSLNSYFHWWSSTWWSWRDIHYKNWEWYYYWWNPMNILPFQSADYQEVNFWWFSVWFLENLGRIYDWFLRDFYYDWNHLNFVQFRDSYIFNHYKFDLVEDEELQYSIIDKSDNLWTFVPFFSGWVAQTGEYVMPWSPWVVLSGDWFTFDPNWTGFVEDSVALSWGFRAFYCPYDWQFLSFTLSSIPWLWLLKSTNIDFDLFKPISCIYFSFQEWQKDMKNKTFPNIDILSWDLLTQIWTGQLYQSTSSSKDLFWVILDIILGWLGIYLFIKFIK